jgi:hypothetical protein
MQPSARFPGRFGGFFLGLAPACFATCCAAACQPPVVQAQFGSERSTWQEFASNDKRLVREQGNLPFAEFLASATCPLGTFGLSARSASGSRQYEGVTNFGGALQTHSDIRHTELKLTYGYAITPQLEPFVSIGFARFTRDIQAAGPVLGYPEEFTLTPIRLGMRWRPDLLGNRLLLSAFAGSALQPQVKVTLPGRDTTRLSLGRTRNAGIAAEFELAKSTYGQWLVQGSWSTLRMEQSATGVVTSNGFPIGAAQQPRSQLDAASVGIAWRKSL